MNRRGFLQIGSLAAIASMLPATLKLRGASKENGVRLFNHLSDKTVFIPLKEGERVSALQIHRHLQELMDNMCFDGDPNALDITDHNPSMRITNEYIQLLDGWDIEEESLMNIGSGNIQINHTGAFYTCVVSIGFSQDDIDNTQIIVDDTVYSQNTFLADLREKNVLVTRGDQFYDARNITGYADKGQPIHSLYVPCLTPKG